MVPTSGCRPATVIPRLREPSRTGYPVAARRGVRAAEGARLEIAYGLKGPSRVQIPPSPSMTSAMSRPSSVRCVEDAGREQTQRRDRRRGRAVRTRVTRSRSPCRRAGGAAHGRQDQLDDAVVLFLDDAADHPLAVEGEGHEQEQRAGIGDQRRCVGRLRLRRMQGCRCELRRRRQVTAKRPARPCRLLPRSRIDVGAEDELVVGEEKQRIDLLGLERLPSGSGRRHDTQRAPSRRRTVVRRARAPRARPDGAGAVTATR